MKKAERRLVLFDAHAIVHRAYHALPDFATKAGAPTGGLYGLTTMLLKAITELQPDYMAACYDLPGPTFRHNVYKEYKAGRAKTDEDLKKQLESSRDIFTAFHIPIYDAPGFEADDMLGTIVEQTKEVSNLEIVIVTGDMDSLQLVSGDRVRVFTLKKGINDTVLYNEEKVRDRYGFGPELLTDYKGIRGDPSDNIIGVKGVGEKTATEILTKIGGIEEVYRALKKGEETLKKAGVKDRMITLLKEQEDEARFSKMLATIRRDAPITYTLPSSVWNKEFDLDAAISHMKRLEFNSLSERIRKMFGAPQNSPQTEQKAAQESLHSPLPAVDPLEIKKVGVALWLVDSDRINPGLEEILEYAETKDFEKAKQKILAELSIGRLRDVYENIELPIIPLLQSAHVRGISIDTEFLSSLSREYHELLNAVTKEIYRDAGEEFNINSPKQLGVVLFEHMGLSQKGLKKTEGGARSTRESELEKLRDTHPIIGKILKHREIQKLLSTYIDNLPGMVGEDGRLHSTLNQAGAATGRMSSTDPNLQNIPVREGLGAHLRNAFVAGDGKVLLALDYSQIEMRVLAMLSKDPGLSEVFQLGEDVHTSVASRVFRVDPKDVTKEMRRRAKVINFGIIYGMGINALKQNLDSSREEAQEFYDQYFLTFPKIAQYFEELKISAAKLGYTETLYGRRRQFHDMKSKIPYIRAAAERMVMNAPIQGTAADIVKIAMKKADDAILQHGLEKEVSFILQVHDELMYEVTDDEKVIRKAAEVIKNAMEHIEGEITESGIPLVVEPKFGKRWGEMGPL